MWTRLKSIFFNYDLEMASSQRQRHKSSSTLAIFVGLVAAMGGFMYGYDTGIINDLLEMPYVKHTFPADKTAFSTHERALITAILSLGTFLGALVAPLLSDNYGRKFSIITTSAIVYNVGSALQTALTEQKMLMAGRFILGLSVGILSAIVPLYQAEASPKWVRGSVVFTYQWAITWGLLIASAVCQRTRSINNSASYRIPSAIEFLWLIVLCVGMLFLPESPRYYIQKDDIPQAIKSLAKLRRLLEDDPDLIDELVDIKANYDYELSFGKSSYLDCFRSGGGRHKQLLRMATGMGVQMFQQCLGINFIFYYGVLYFATTGIKSYYLVSLITYCVNTVATVPGMIFVETLGRRLLLIYGGCGMTIANFVIAIVAVSDQSQNTKAITTICLACVFIALFACSWGGCAWAICSDIYGVGIRQKAMSLTAASNWLANFVLAYITPYLTNSGEKTAALGSKIFFVWGTFNLLGVVFVWFTVYETKGLKLEEIDQLYVACKNPWLLASFKPVAIDHCDTYQVLRRGGMAIPMEMEKSTSSGDDHSHPNVDSRVSGRSCDVHNKNRANVGEHACSCELEPNDYHDYLMLLQTSGGSLYHVETTANALDLHLVASFNGGHIPLLDKSHAKLPTKIDSRDRTLTKVATPFFDGPPSDSDED